MRLFIVFQLKTLFEAVNTSAGINKFLFAGKERMTVRANVKTDLFFSGTGLKLVTAGALNGGLYVFRMKSFFQLRHPFLKITSFVYYHKFLQIASKILLFAKHFLF